MLLVLMCPLFLCCVLTGPEDHQLTVAFSNGHTEKVPMEMAICVPQPIYERISLELKMPQDTRSAIMTTDHYPLHSLPGYPTSGPKATPPEFYTPENFSLEPSPYYPAWEPLTYPEYLGYCPPYPIVLRPKQEQLQKRDPANEDEDMVIPGTNMTKRQLDERVLSQITEHRLSEGHQQQLAASRLLRRREKLEENTLKKSVTFNESDLVQVAPEKDRRSPLSDPRTDADSGFASSPELDWEYLDPLTQAQLDRIDEERRLVAEERHKLEVERRLLELEEKRACEVSIDPRLLFYRSPGVGKRKPWRYWRNDPSPSLPVSGGGSGGGGEGGSVGRSSHGPFRETALQAPLEARDQRRSPYIGK